MAGNPWTDEDRLALEELTVLGWTEPEIAKKLGRTKKSINIQRWKLGIKHEPRTYQITSPEGTVFDNVHSLNLFAQENLGGGRRSPPAMGLIWAEQSGTTGNA